MVCEYVNQCCYERKELDFICQNELLPSHCGLYQRYKAEEQEALKESKLEVISSLRLSKELEGWI